MKMDSRGGCCIARYTGGGGAYDHMSKMDRIMLKFRPIAPKPAVGGGSVCRDDIEVPVKSGGRGKRRYVKENNSNSNNNNGVNGSKRSCGRKRKASTPEENNESSPAVVTLPLLPETPDRKDSPARGSSSESTDRYHHHRVGVGKKMVKNAPIWLSFGDNTNQHVTSDAGHVTAGGGGGLNYGAMMSSPRVVVSSWVKVECVTDTWVDVYALGGTDQDKLMGLHKDTCPGFISDGENRVRWANGAYKEMVGGMEGEEVIVWLGLKEGERFSLTRAAFTCQVRVFTCRKDKNKNKDNSLTLPCDVWRLDSGGFAWRLDTKAALSLGW